MWIQKQKNSDTFSRSFQIQIAVDCCMKNVTHSNSKSQTNMTDKRFRDKKS